MAADIQHPYGRDELFRLFSLPDGIKCTLVTGEPPAMFERFTDRARRVVILAEQEARNMGHTDIACGHLVCALLAEGEGLGGQALAALGLTLDGARGQVTSRADDKSPLPAHLPFTPLAKKALGQAHREALILGHNYVGTEHILLGIAAVGEGSGAAVLVALGVNSTDARSKVLEMIRAGHPYPERGWSWKARPYTHVQDVLKPAPTTWDVMEGLSEISGQLKGIGRTLAGLSGEHRASVTRRAIEDLTECTDEELSLSLDLLDPEKKKRLREFLEER